MSVRAQRSPPINPMRDALATMAAAGAPTGAALADWTDAYFTATRGVVERFGDAQARYLVFLRVDALAALDLAEHWLAQARPGLKPAWRLPEGAEAPAKTPVMALEGALSDLIELETLLLQKIGPACVAARNARDMALALPNAAFLAMDARHCAGVEMAGLMAYAAACGSAAAQAQGARGFIGNATNATATLFGAERGYGTLPHALIGYAGDTVKAVEMTRARWPDRPIVALVDYFAHEVSDALAVCRRFAGEAEVSIRLDTPGERYVEGLDAGRARALIAAHAPGADPDDPHLTGPGVSAAAVLHLRAALDAAGFEAAKIVCSSGFTVAKCRVFGAVGVPVDVVGTGSYIPGVWSETYATADVVAYDGVRRVKAGREWLADLDPLC